MKPPDPPRISRLLLTLLLRGEEREVITGDLEEEYRDLAGSIGQRDHAARWYRSQALRTVTGRTWERARRMVRRAALGRGAPQRQHTGSGLGRNGTPGWGGKMLGEFWQDLRFGLRALVKEPAFTAVAGLTLALGVGANTAMFGVLDDVLLRPLAYPDADRLVQVWSGRVLSKSTMLRIRDAVPSFQAVTGYASRALALTGVGAAEEIEGAAVSPSHFDVMGVRPELGRAFLSEEATEGHEAVVIFSHGLWVDRFGADPDVLGRSVVLGGRPHTIVGVMPAGYRPVSGRWRLWVPLTIDPTDFSDYEGTAGTTVLARLAPGATASQAEEEMKLLALALQAEEPSVFDEAFVAQATAVPILDATVASARVTLWLLLGAVGMVLLIACANVANLLLAQGMRRDREMAVRRALGASRRRLVRQLLTENLVLGTAGGLVGVGVAAALLWGLRAHLASGIPRGDTIAFDQRVVAFAVLLSLVTTLLFGLFPAVRATHPDLRPGLADGGRRGSGSGRRSGMNRLLMGVEMAISVVLLVGAGLLLKSSWILQRVDPGFRSENLLTLKLTLPEDEYSDSVARVNYVGEVEGRVAALPGVTGVGSVTFLPMTSMHISTVYTVDGRSLPEGSELPYAMAQLATSGILEALGIPLLRGRWFDSDDPPGPGLTGVINEALAAEAFPGEDPLGRQMQMFGTVDFTVIGVIGDTRQTTLDQPPRPEAFFSFRQFPAMGSLYLVVRTAADPDAVTAGILGAARSVDADVPISRVATMDAVLRSTTAGTRLAALLFCLFAALALLLGIVGVYGVISYTVSTRTYEIGVRIAMGARQGEVTREILAYALIPVAGGLAAGLAGALALSRLLSSLLFEVQPWDPFVLTAAAGTLAVAAVLASFSPVRRAASVDPARCLTAE